MAGEGEATREVEEEEEEGGGEEKEEEEEEVCGLLRGARVVGVGWGSAWTVSLGSSSAMESKEWGSGVEVEGGEAMAEVLSFGCLGGRAGEK